MGFVVVLDGPFRDIVEIPKSKTYCLVLFRRNMGEQSTSQDGHVISNIISCLIEEYKLPSRGIGTSLVVPGLLKRYDALL